MLCIFGRVYPLHSGHESCFVVFLVAFCKRLGLYQSAVTQSVSCLGAGLALTMLMTGLVLNCEALWFYLWTVEWTLFFLASSQLCTFVLGAYSLVTLMTHICATNTWDLFKVLFLMRSLDGKALEEQGPAWEKLFLVFGMCLSSHVIDIFSDPGRY